MCSANDENSDCQVFQIITSCFQSLDHWDFQASEIWINGLFLYTFVSLHVHSKVSTMFFNADPDCIFLAVSNKWIHERGQEFRRPCGLNPRDLQGHSGFKWGPCDEQWEGWGFLTLKEYVLLICIINLRVSGGCSARVLIIAKYSLLDLIVVTAAKCIVREALCINIHRQLQSGTHCQQCDLSVWA